MKFTTVEEQLYSDAMEVAPWWVKFMPRSVVIHFLKCGYIAGFKAGRLSIQAKSRQNLSELKAALNRIEEREDRIMRQRAATERTIH